MKKAILGILVFLPFILPASPRIGLVVAWGDVGINYVEPGTAFTQIAAGPDHNLALTQQGTVIGWGDNWGGHVNIPAGLDHVANIAAGYYHSMAVKADGTVVAWGDNSRGQTNVPAGLPTSRCSRVASIIRLRSRRTVRWRLGEATVPARQTSRRGWAWFK